MSDKLQFVDESRLAHGGTDGKLKLSDIFRLASADDIRRALML